MAWGQRRGHRCRKQASKQDARIRQLYYGDNLPVLRTMPDGMVDLVYLDPPFNSNRAYNVIYPDDMGQVTAFEDTWAWKTECDQYLADIEAHTSELSHILPALVQGMGKTQLSAYLVNMAVRLLELHRVLKPTGSLYLHCDPTASHYLKVVLDAIFGREQFRNEIVWCYRGAGYPATNFGKKHDIIFRYSKTKTYTFNLDDVRDAYASATVERFKHHIGNIRGETDFGQQKLHKKGRRPDDWWEIQPIAPSAKERLGYPTQKPLALLNRIIQASSNPGDLILDPFCGCGTTVEAAENSGRNWIGIDITYAAISAIQERFRRNRIDVWRHVQIEGAPKTVEDVDSQLLNQAHPLYARKEFEKFCVATIGGMPNDKMGADGGIDGRISLEGGKRALVSVKSGEVGVAQLRELRGLLDKKHIAGVFVTRRPPTQPMLDFANQAGIVHLNEPKGGGLLPSRTCPVLQIVTLEDILAGKPLDLPRPARKV